MGTENKLKPSKQSIIKRRWFWPSIYGGLAMLLVITVVSYNALQEPSTQPTLALPNTPDGSNTIPVTAQAETMKYPLSEELLKDVQLLQHYYDVSAPAELQQNALLVFNQTFISSQGISISVKGEPFQVVAAMGGTVKSIRMDPFTGNELIIEHSNGYTTIYNSIAEILVQEGDPVKQGEPLATTIENEANPYAGIHLHFKVMKDGAYMNPTSLLAF